MSTDLTDPSFDSRSNLESVLSYHERTKHHPHRYANSLGYMEWRTQPDPFRFYEGAETVVLDEVAPSREPDFGDLPLPDSTESRRLDRVSVSQLLYDSLAISAWKEFQGSRWSLRVNPSSGALHPTEGYLLMGPVSDLSDRPSLFHYSPFLHSLERRVELTTEEWAALVEGLPSESILMGLTSIYWRESWKYGERAFRYCQHDVGHAIACMAYAASGLGWKCRLLEACTDGDISCLLGIESQEGPEAEHPDCLLVVYPNGAVFPGEIEKRWRPPPTVLDGIRARGSSGTPNRLSSDHHSWPIVEAVSEASTRRESPSDSYWGGHAWPETAPSGDVPRVSAREVMRRRRSAVAMDGTTYMERDSFLSLLSRIVPSHDRQPFAALPWTPAIHLVLFVHRVHGIPSGCYFLPRTSTAADEVRRVSRKELEWSPLPEAPAGLGLFRLLADDTREAAQAISCMQEIASDGVFAVAMLAKYESTIRRHGAWFYKRLHWEAGVVGQALYLEAEARGLRGTGIGCFFDDLLHAFLGIGDRSYQSVYHFTVGGFVEDGRLRTLPSYGHRSCGLERRVKPERDRLPW